MTVIKIKDERSIYEVCDFAKKQKDYMEIQCAPGPGAQMLRTQQIYNAELGKYIHLIVRESRVCECVLYGTEEDTFYNFEMVIYELDGEVHMLLNTISLDARTLSNELLTTFTKRLSAKDITNESLVFKRPFYSEEDVMVEIFLHKVFNNNIK